MAISLSLLLNGERAVVMLFIGCVLFSLPQSLLVHGIILCLLAFIGLCIEIRADALSARTLFKTRPGASSGILLGSVTLPTVMLSKMIQLSRAFSDNKIELDELNYHGMQYWAAIANCFSVLIFLSLTMWCPTVNARSNKRNAWMMKFIISCIMLFSAVIFLPNIDIQPTLNWLWMLFHGFVSVKLVQQLLNSFPSCASIGETLLVTSGLVIYFADMLASTIARLHEFVSSSESVPIKYGIRRSEISIINQGLLLSLLLFPMIFKFVLHICSCLPIITKSKSPANNERRKSLIFFLLFSFTMVVISPSWMQLVWKFDVHPLLWVIMFVFSEPLKRLLLCIYWVCLICVSVLRFYQISKNSKIERILLRKYYHLLAVFIFVPAVIIQPKFLDLAFGAALAVFLTLEIIRVWRIWPLGQLVHQFMNAFTDHRDSDLLIVSHFSLLLGCALPIWMSSGYNDRPLAPFAGILSLGIGDTMASVVGYKYGVIRWSKTGKKTIEGTAAGILSVLTACSVLLPVLASTGYVLSQHWVSLLLAVTISGLLEAYTAQLDNAFIPLIFYSLLCL